MISAQRVAPQPAPELRRLDRVRHATQRRTRRTRRRLQRPVFAVVTLALAVLVPLLAYVTLTANVTSLSFAIVRADRERTTLANDAQRRDNTIAKLQSPERLAALAAKLRLHDPHVYAVVRIPEPKAQPRATGLAFFGTWFSASAEAK
jgi:hypothetical protein